jgi:N-acetylglutamate synthase
MPSILNIEELSMNAWPSLRSVLYDGWVLRFANGYTRRANSVHPLYPSHRDIEQKIRACEEVYRDEGLPVTFKLTPAALPPDLDHMLDSQGYSLVSPTSVQILDISRRPGATPAIRVAGALDDNWLASACAFNGLPERHRLTLEHMLRSLVPEACFASIRNEQAIVACGLGVVQDGHVGLFDIVTDPRLRRQGHGRALVQGMLDWGRQNGAHTAYLQVVPSNEPAIRLYAGLGFKELYRYWYRVGS